MERFKVLLLLVLLLLGEAHAHRYKEHSRYRRQISDEPSQQIDLNVTVPYIFSARLYNYGASYGDLEMHGRREAYKLENPIHFMGEVYDTLYISRDGSVRFIDDPTVPQRKPSALPVEEPTIAVFWQPTTLGRVYYRETDDVNIMNLAHNEVNIQYRYGSQFRVRSVILVTWEDIRDPQNLDAEGNTIQLALIIGDSMTFAHLVYSKLNYNFNAIAGFSSHQNHYSLPDSATNEAILLSEKSDIGIPGEWLFRIDNQQIYLCGAGFKGLECIESCAPSQWFNDCSRSCHCDNGDSCDQETGRCPNGKCSPGWTGEPTCDQDLDECETGVHSCPNEQPDCLNTPGSFLCLCFEYDEERGACKTARPVAETSAPIPVDVLPLRPSFARNQATSQRPTQTHRNRFKSTTVATTVPATMSTRMVEQTSDAFNTPLITTIATIQTTTTNLPTTTKAPACSHCDINAECDHGICRCTQGFTGDGFRCYDIDECLGDACGPHSLCSNNIGGYECSCVGGYRLDEIGRCVDVDECRETPNICGDNGTACRNRDGSFECVCREGFTGNPSDSCHDVDECVNDACGPNAKCTNVPGSYECECLPGYERLAEGAHCTDRDECAVEPCHPAAICSNTRGSYTCECIDGYVGDGKMCHETILYPISNDSIVIARSWDSVTTIPLLHPIELFGKRYSNAFISTNGLISFSHPLNGLIERAESIHDPVIFALHAQFDYIRDGLIAYTFVNDTDASTLPLLMRSTIGVQTAFHLNTFETKRLHIFTFDRVRQAGSENFNSFQVVLAESSEATVLSLIYEKVQARGPLTGLATPSRFVMLPNTELTRRSNVGQPGKWMFRVDGAELQTCPPGRTGEPTCDSECESGRYGVQCTSTCHCEGGAPCDAITGMCPGALCRAGWEGAACDQDIDECSLQMVTCAFGSECVNTRGGYRCDCKKGFVPIGKECKKLETCLQRYGVPCSRNGRCDETAKCVCNVGYHGDGFKCTANGDLKPNGTLLSDLTRQLIETSREHGHPLSNETDVGEKPFLMNNWMTESTPTKPKTDNVAPIVPPRMYTAPPIKPTLHDKDIENNEGAKEKVEDNDGMHLVFVILPTALIIIWIVLIFIVVVLCKMNKRKREANHQIYAPAWKTNYTNTSRSLMPATSTALSNPNVMYGRTPRITPYDGY